MHVLVLNAGSASLKFDIIDMDRNSTSASSGKKLVSGILEGIGDVGAISLLQGKDVIHRETISASDYAQAAKQVLAYLETTPGKTWPGLSEIDLVGHRVVHGADRFTGPVAIDDEVIADIEKLEDIAPLHNAPAVSVIRIAREMLGPQKHMVAVFDTVFHRNIPPPAHTYAIPPELSTRYRIRRYGFHGPSHQYLLERYAEITGTPLEKATIVTTHLESGCSVCAIQNGRSIETSMGFTPLEGLVMGTRSGDIDPALVGFLSRKEQRSLDQIDDLPNKHSGLLGLSGVSHDTRELMKHFENEQVRLALDVFCHRAVKYIGAYLAVLGGADAVVFGGGIGEDSPWIRARICDAFRWCGLQLDRSENDGTINREARISSAGAQLHAYVIPTEEALCVAQELIRCQACAAT